MTSTRLEDGYRGKTVAVTGSRGYLGTALADALRRTGASRLLVTRRADPEPPVSDDEALLVADPRTADCWREIVCRADVIVHLASNTSVHAATADPADSFRSTVLPIAHLVAAAQTLRRTPRVVYASTATVYGLPDRLPVDEDETRRPVTVYDLHKWFAEQQLALATRHGLVEGVSLRLTNVYGPSAGARSAGDRGVVTRVAIQALEGRTLSVYGHGRYLRDYVYIDDVVQAFVIAGIHPALSSGAFNVGSGTGTMLRDAFELIADRAASVTGRRCDIREVPWPDGADPIDARQFVADTRRFREACGWRPMVSLREGVDRLLRDLERRP